ncbi:sulfatase family protein [Rubrobacter tropicus]|uniref:sulfatase family protein n=1 Tax=Rubrobacter tropicus TaxID=2653851 RepID=UPI0014089969|nr:sulfatase [Rubrobacter tropicus]
MRGTVPRAADPVRAAYLVLVSLLLASCLPSAEGQQPEPEKAEQDRPNVVLVVTDDLAARDLNPQTLKAMPNIRSLAEGGTTFENAFVTDSLCCPSRTTILRGQYAHNHQVLTNAPPLGGAEKFRVSGGDASTVATWLQEDGYRTSFFGKYLNGYFGDYVPPGWDEWYGVSGNFLSNSLNENGAIIDYDPERYHLDDVLADKASGYVRRTAGADPPFFTSDRPFLMWLGTKAPHQPATPAPRHEDAFGDAELPRPPSFDEADVSDKPGWVRDNVPLGSDQVAYMEELNRDRMRSMLAVDDMVGDLLDALRESNELDNTYVVFTSDNGFHMGEHRLGAGKWTAYEEDIRVPLIVRGPGVPEGKTLPHMVLNNDIAPTIADLAEVDPPDFVDGRSVVPLLDDTPTPEKDWRQRFLVEAVAERGAVPRPPFVDESRVVPLVTGDPLPRDWRKTSAGRAESGENWGRPWLKALRTKDYLFVEYKTGEHELYDLRKDPYELNNIYESAPPDLLERLNAQLDSLRQCERENCRTAEDGRSTRPAGAASREQGTG